MTDSSAHPPVASPEDPSGEAAETEQVERADPSLEPSAARGNANRAWVGLVLEVIGISASVWLLTKLFEDRWIEVEPVHWGLLAVSLLTIVGFFVCVSAMFRHRREIAAAGVWIGIVGSIGTGVCGTMILAAEMELWGTRSIEEMIASTEALLEEVDDDLQAFVDVQLASPSPAEAEELLDGRKDAWGVPLRYQQFAGTSYELSSAGPNETHGDADDLRKVH